MLEIEDIFNWLQTAGIKYENTLEQKQLGLDLLCEEYSELDNATKACDHQEILDGSCDLVWIICNNLLFNGISLKEFEQYFKKVSISNWSKFCDTEEDAFRTLEAYQTGQHWSKPGEVIDCYAKQVGDKYIIFRHDGKILKSLYYKDVKEL